MHATTPVSVLASPARALAAAALARLLLALVLAVAAVPSASAQCFAGTQHWPGTIAFDPPHPDAGQPVSVVIGPASQVRAGASSVERVDGHIQIWGFYGNDYDPTPILTRIDLGPLPTGVFQVDAGFLADEQIGPCGGISGTLLVGSATLPVPGLGAFGAAALAGLLLVIGWSGMLAARRAGRL